MKIRTFYTLYAICIFMFFSCQKPAEPLPVEEKEYMKASYIGSGFYTSYAIKEDGSIKSFGLQIGDHSNLRNVIQIEGGSGFTLVVKEDGTVWGWGMNNDGLMGDSTTDTRNIPVQLKSLNNIAAISCGLSHSLALTRDGKVWAWGDNSYGQLGDSTTNKKIYPVEIRGISDIICISAGATHSLAVKSDGTVWTWGKGGNTNSISATDLSESLYPEKVSEISDAVKVAAGNLFSICLKSDGSVWGWGTNDKGQIGDGTNEYAFIPKQVLNLTGIINIEAAYNSIALKSDSTVYTWGINNYGSLGLGIQQVLYNNAPERLGLESITAITNNFNYSNFALAKDSLIWAWGNNTHGQLGDGSTIQRYSPVKMSNSEQ